MAKPLTAWSFSRLQTYEKCPLQFKLMVIDGNREEKSEAQLRGDRIHKAAANYLAGATDQPGDLLEADAIGSFKQLFQDLRALKPFVEQEWAFTDNWQTTGYFAKNTWWRVILDACVLYDDNYADVIDHKTGKPYGDNEDQMDQFATAVFVRYPHIHTVGTRLWYLDKGIASPDKGPQIYTRDQLPELKKKWKDRVAPMFADKTYNARPGNHCRFCHFRRANGGPCKFG